MKGEVITIPADFPKHLDEGCKQYLRAAYRLARDAAVKDIDQRLKAAYSARNRREVARLQERMASLFWPQ
jgi:hypothetical protein